jgi:hypothetical protein
MSAIHQSTKLALAGLAYHVTPGADTVRSLLRTTDHGGLQVSSRTFNYRRGLLT